MGYTKFWCVYIGRDRPRPLELGSMIMFGSVYTGLFLLIKITITIHTMLIFFATTLMRVGTVTLKVNTPWRYLSTEGLPQWVGG